MAEVKWIKLTTDMFDNRKIKHLRKMPDGNNLVLIWVMLLTMAGRCNAGGMIFLTENIPYTPKMLADELGFEENTVVLALKMLEQLEMIVTDGAYFGIAGWSEHQNIDGMDKIREQNRLRKAAQRQRQNALPASRDSHVTVTQCHATDKDKDKEEEEDDNNDQKIVGEKALEAEFADIWTLYPRKVGKKKALAAYIRARKKGVTAEAVTDGVKRYVASIAAKGTPTQYIKQGATWFDGACWDDDYTDNGNTPRPAYGSGTTPLHQIRRADYDSDELPF